MCSVAVIAASLCITATSYAAPVNNGGGYAENKVASCNDAVFCKLDYTKIPAGKVLVVSNVSCYASSTNSSGTKQVTLEATTAPFVTNYLRPVAVGNNTQTGSLYWNVNNYVTALINAGQIPRIEVQWLKSNNSTIECTIAGFFGGSVTKMPASMRAPVIKAANVKVN